MSLAPVPSTVPGSMYPPSAPIINSSDYNYYNPQFQQPHQQQQHQTQTQPRMLSFREYVQQNLDPNDKLNKFDAVRQTRYNQYKEKFRAEQIEKFFQAHKADDWFRARYHPKDSQKRKEEQRKWIKNRLEIFTCLIEKYSDLSLDSTNESNLKQLYKFIDECVVKMEDGLDAKLDEAPAQKEKDRKSPKIETKNIEESSKSASDPSGSEDEEGKLNDSFVSNVSVDDAQNSPTNSQMNTVPKKTVSIFFKNLPLIITRSDLERVSKNSLYNFKFFKKKLDKIFFKTLRLVENSKVISELLCQSRHPIEDFVVVHG